ncbi:GFA family protein [Vibrio parahaemolyticus]|uniref:GFA family protein n=1 Tax=Vibrio parahaemolyticus TaxID=670 RepID=UPI000470E663|nr:GFA family protein [Vibrio parahaemolyticus]ANB99944.1 Glutathione-dependent formaldehyde-activating enzyme [Vibrio parahaemolyticus]EGQ7894188.1 GFA family protein [Vibrio parahaemolyticus]EGQ8478213.1 aldehyde-activating protein [Vibrio parahaemolyticus]EGR1283773.1 GFA family protein [Vibrio parahaemolyticus]EGR1788827.1 GFA family protein [Vibrio parahaemolyticus]
MTNIIHTGECACGLVQLRCKDEPLRTSICHCFECQKRTGSVFGVQAKFDKEQVILDGDTTNYTRISDDGNEVKYEFCSACGTTMRLLLSAAPEIVVVPVGIFNNTEFHEPKVSIYEQRKHGWVSFECTMEHIQ